MILKQKRVGTVLSMTALVSKTVDSGTFVAGEKFINWLARSKQTAWQFLPLHQTQLEKGSKTKHVPSPYKGYGIGLDPRFLGNDSSLPSAKQQAKFAGDNNYWLKDYVLFCALRDYFGTDNWNQWPTKIRKRDLDSLKKWRKKLAPQIDLHLKIQTQLHLAYQQLQKRATDQKILLIGDLPFYLGLNSSLVWQYQHLFDLGETDKLQRVSGVPLGPKSHFGRQVWGHPLYKWQDNDLLPEIEKLFQIRLKYLASLFDWIRLDHAKGLFFYGVMDLTNNNPDQYLKGPGSEFLEKLIKFTYQQNINIYAEDTGDNLKELRRCLRQHKIPGIKIFRFAYNEKKKIFFDQYLETAKYPINTFAYTTTNDTETLMGYLKQLSAFEVDALIKKLGFSHISSLSHLAKSIRDKVIHSPAKTVLIPLQDWLLTTDRVNTPGTEKEINDLNWHYQMTIPIEDLPIYLY
jgi:4-alpha-glucanotransferase